MTAEDWDTCLAIILAEDLLAMLREVETIAPPSMGVVE